jgi:L-amino acid N-acyltransferase YncA
MLHPDVLQPHGVGKRLLQEAIAHGPQLGIHSLVGLIFDHNQPSSALFRAAGFERWGLLPGVARVDETPRDLTIFGRHI